MAARTSAALLVLFLLAGCAKSVSDASGPRGADLSRVRSLFAAIDERNRTVKRSEQWIADAYTSVRIARLNDIPPSAFPSYARFAGTGEAYVIVHPGYYPFFDDGGAGPVPRDYSRGLPAQNLAEQAVRMPGRSHPAFRVAAEQERILRDFIEFASADGRLVVLVLPRDHRAHLANGYVPGYDEYVRYLNELTNGAENIVYLESASHDSGYLREGDLGLLMELLRAAGVRRVQLGGGFLGRCLDNLAGSLRRRLPHGDIRYVMDLTAFPPGEIVADWNEFLTFFGRLSGTALREHYRSVPINRTTGEPLLWSRLTLYPDDVR